MIDETDMQTPTMSVIHILFLFWYLRFCISFIPFNSQSANMIKSTFVHTCTWLKRTLLKNWNWRSKFIFLTWIRVGFPSEPDLDDDIWPLKVDLPPWGLVAVRRVGLGQTCAVVTIQEGQAINCVIWRPYSVVTGLLCGLAKGDIVNYWK